MTAKFELRASDFSRLIEAKSNTIVCLYMQDISKKLLFRDT